MRIAIIGAGGLLSQSLFCYYNQPQHDLYLYGRRKPEEVSLTQFISYDVCVNNLESEEFFNYDLVLYATGSGVQSNAVTTIEDIYNVNTIFPIKLFSELNKGKFKGTLVTFGSYFEIGINHHHKKYSEFDIVSHCNALPNDYCHSKRMFTIYSHSQQRKFRHVHAILPTIFGPMEQSNRLIPYLISCFKNAKIPNLTSGEQIRQYLYVEDLPEMITGILNHSGHEGVINIPSCETTSIKELSKKIASYYGQELKDESFNRESRTDSGMRYLMLDTKIFNTCTKLIRLKKIEEIIEHYQNGQIN